MGFWQNGERRTFEEEHFWNKVVYAHSVVKQTIPFRFLEEEVKQLLIAYAVASLQKKTALVFFRSFVFLLVKLLNQ